MGKTWMGKASVVLGLISWVLPLGSRFLFRGLGGGMPAMYGASLSRFLVSAQDRGWIVTGAAGVALGIWAVIRHDCPAGWIGLALGGVPILAIVGYVLLVLAGATVVN